MGTREEPTSNKCKPENEGSFKPSQNFSGYRFGRYEQWKITYAIFVAGISDETAGIVLHKGVTDLLSMLPVKKEGEAKGVRLELSSADWTGDEVPVFCTA